MRRLSDLVRRRQSILRKLIRDPIAMCIINPNCTIWVDTQIFNFRRQLAQLASSVSCAMWGI